VNKLSYLNKLLITQWHGQGNAIRKRRISPGCHLAIFEPITEYVHIDPKFKQLLSTDG